MTAVSVGGWYICSLQTLIITKNWLIKDDMAKVLKTRDTVTESMRNPFVSTVAAEKLVNIATGEILTSSDVVDSKQLGLDAIAYARSTDAEKIISPKILTLRDSRSRPRKGKTQ